MCRIHYSRVVRFKCRTLFFERRAVCSLAFHKSKLYWWLFLFRYSVLIGDWDKEAAANCELHETTSLCADPTIEIKIQLHYIHSGFAKGDSANDIALVQLVRPIMIFTGTCLGPWFVHWIGVFNCFLGFSVLFADQNYIEAFARGWLLQRQATVHRWIWWDAKREKKHSKANCPSPWPRGRIMQVGV